MITKAELKEHGIRKSDVTVKYCLLDPSKVGVIIPKKYLGKNKDGKVRTQREARSICSKIRQMYFRERNLYYALNKEKFAEEARIQKEYYFGKSWSSNWGR